VYINKVPTLYWFKNIAIRIHTNDHGPAHRHAEAPDAWPKIDLKTLQVMEAEGFTKSELKIITEFVSIRASRLMDKWKEIHQ
jgi:hypothetical protein